MLNKALRLIRVYHDMKQSEAAEKLGISKSYLSEIESGHKEPTLDIIRKYEVVFGIPASSIMFFSENLDQPGSRQTAKKAVASKVIQIMQFLEQRSGHMNAD